MASQRDKSPQETSKSLGGKLLRQLRLAAGFSLMDLAAELRNDREKAIDTAHINKIERGSIKQPTAETLETILDGLHASYRDRRDVLEAFGYAVPVTLPTDEEIAEARRLTAHELQDSTYPMCVIDVSQRIWAWNRYTPRIIGLHPDDPATSQFLGVTLFDVTLNPAFATRLLIDNPDEYLPAMLEFIKAGIYMFHAEPWYQDMIAQARTFPGFSALWEHLPTQGLHGYAYRSIVPIRLRVPGSGVLQFRLSNTDFLPDPRFDIIHFTPFGATTLRACAQWAEEEGVL